MLLFLLGTACTENEFHSKDDVTSPGETGAVECPPQILDCNDSGDDTGVIDTEILNPDDCEVEVAPSKTVEMNDECAGTGSGGGDKDHCWGDKDLCWG